MFISPDMGVLQVADHWEIYGPCYSRQGDQLFQRRGRGGAYFRFTNSFSSESLILYFAGDN